MERKHFLKLSMLAVPTVAVPLSVAGWPKSSDRITKGLKVDAGQDRFNGEKHFGGAYPNSLKVSGQDTNGDLCVFEGSGTGRGAGPPLHVHYEQDELFFVVEGEFIFQVGSDKFNLKAGDHLLAPRKVPHTFMSVKDGPNKMLTTFQPAGQMEDFFIELGKHQGMPPREVFMKLFKDHGMDIVGPPLAPG